MNSWINVLERETEVHWDEYEQIDVLLDLEQV